MSSKCIVTAVFSPIRIYESHHVTNMLHKHTTHLVGISESEHRASSRRLVQIALLPPREVAARGWRSQQLHAMEKDSKGR